MLIEEQIINGCNNKINEHYEQGDEVVVCLRCRKPLFEVFGNESNDGDWEPVACDPIEHVANDSEDSVFKLDPTGTTMENIACHTEETRDGENGFIFPIRVVELKAESTVTGLV